MAETHLKQPIRNVVYTRIHRACAMAGLHLLKLIPQLTAVASASSTHENID
jgi:hypothetical protein